MTVTAHLKYLRYVLRHKWFVFLAGLKIGVPAWQLIVHDWSKFLPDEWFPYVGSFYVDRTRYRARFDRAWNAHQKRHKHHWQYWLLVNDEDGTYPLPIPERHVREMVADWCGAGRAITGKWEVATWYDKNRDRMILHEGTRLRVNILVLEFRP